MKRLIILMLMIAGNSSIYAQKAKQATSKTDSSTIVVTNYTCPMHTDVVSDKQGHCPKCGMALVKSEPSTNPSTVYTCLMHSDVVSDKPGNCPKCGMQLVEKKAGKKAKKKGMRMMCCK